MYNLSSCDQKWKFKGFFAISCWPLRKTKVSTLTKVNSFGHFFHRASKAAFWVVRALPQIRSDQIRSDILIYFRVGIRAIFIDWIFMNLFSRFILNVYHWDYHTNLKGHCKMRKLMIYGLKLQTFCKKYILLTLLLIFGQSLLPTPIL